MKALILTAPNCAAFAVQFPPEGGFSDLLFGVRPPHGLRRGEDNGQTVRISGPEGALTAVMNRIPRHFWWLGHMVELRVSVSGTRILIFEKDLTMDQEEVIGAMSKTTRTVLWGAGLTNEELDILLSE